MSKSFNADFYVAIATIIPVLYLAITLQSRTFEDLMQRLRKSLPQNQPADTKPTVRSVAFNLLTFLITVVAAVIIFAGIGVEFVSFFALYQRKSTPRMDLDVLVLTGSLLVVVVTGPVIRFLLIYFGDRFRRNREPEDSPASGTEGSPRISEESVTPRNSISEADMRIRGRGKALLAVGYALGRLAGTRRRQHPENPGKHDESTRAVTPNPTSAQDKPRKRKLSAAVSNPLAVALISAVVASGVSFAVAHYQSQDAARQAISGEQTQELVQMQATARRIDQDGMAVANYAYNCAVKGSTWSDCFLKAPDYPQLNADVDVLGTVIYNVTDQKANLIARKYLVAMIFLSAPRDRQDGYQQWLNTGTLENELIQRCGLLIRGSQ